MVNCNFFLNNLFFRKTNFFIDSIVRLMVGELFAADIKGIGGSVAGASSWIFAFIVTKTFSNIQTAIGIGPTFWLLSGFSILGTVFVFFVVPETKGKSLSEIQTMLSGHHSPTDTEVTASVSDVDRNR